MTDYEIDIREIKETLKQMQDAIQEITKKIEEEKQSSASY